MTSEGYRVGGGSSTPVIDFHLQTVQDVCLSEVRSCFHVVELTDQSTSVILLWL
eukprot:m.42663 g.42663  ORF g.42663 m.42663 type:complete len:54 (+) comp11959_c0_seq1:791-952(+)